MSESTWVPVYVERAICDLIPDTPHAREIARIAWAWDDAHTTCPNALYRWQNEAIRQRRDLIALQEELRMQAQNEANYLSDDWDNGGGFDVAGK